MIFSVDVNNLNATKYLSNHLRKNIGDEYIIVCIGCDQIIGDKLGPLVGTMLNDSRIISNYIYGLLGNNINATNIDITIDFIKKLHGESKIVVIDAAIGLEGEIGCLQSYNGPISPGSATQKKLSCIGDVSVVGVVSTKLMNDFYTLSETKIQQVTKMAKTIVEAFKNLSNPQIIA